MIIYMSGAGDRADTNPMSNMNDPMAVKQAFRGMMAGLMESTEVSDSMGRTVLVSFRAALKQITDADLLGALARMEDHDEPVDLSDPQAVIAEFWAIVPLDFKVSGWPVTAEEKARQRKRAKFAANARRLKDGEITREEFNRIMRDDQ